MTTDTEVRDALNEAAAAAGLRIDPTIGEADLDTLEGPFITMEVPTAGGDQVSIVVALRDGPEADTELLETLAVATTTGVIGGPGPTQGEPVLTGAELVARFDTPIAVTALTDGTAVQAVVVHRSDRRSNPEENDVPDGADQAQADQLTDPAPAVTPAPAPPPASSPAPAPGSVPASLGRSLDKLVNVELGVSVELGRAHVTLADVLDYDVGSVVELDRAAGSPVDIRVNGMLLAQGEVVLIDDEYAVRITTIVDAQTEH
ncbi:MAG: flagellar motor switch protein FliN [Actinomycetota bacterium]